MTDPLDLDELERLAKAAIAEYVGGAIGGEALYRYLQVSGPGLILALIARVREAEARGPVVDAEWARQMVASAEQFRAEAEAERDEWKARAVWAERVVEAAMTEPFYRDVCPACRIHDGHDVACEAREWVDAQPIQQEIRAIMADVPMADVPDDELATIPPYGGSTLTFLQPIAGMAHEDDE